VRGGKGKKCYLIAVKTNSIRKFFFFSYEIFLVGVGRGEGE